jgi:tetratricopeptide (TPR) repeat protein
LATSLFDPSFLRRNLAVIHIVFLALCLVGVSTSVGTAAQPVGPRFTITEGLTLYARGEFEANARALQDVRDVGRFHDDFKEEAETWIDAGGPAERDQRRLAAAAFALEAAHATLFDVQSAWRTLEWACEVLRKNAKPSPSEYAWHRAAVAWLLGISSGLPGPRGTSYASSHLAHARKRFPHDPRWHLAQAILDHELPTWPFPRPALMFKPPEGPSRVREIGPAIRGFEGLLRLDALRAETHLRIGHLEYRRGRLKEALAQFEQVEPLTDDAALIYLARFFRGQLLEQKGDVAAAITAYERALEAWPGAQSASVALAAILFQQDQRARAFELVLAALARPTPDDPWRTYGQGDFRQWPQLLASLRQFVR